MADFVSELVNINDFKESWLTTLRATGFEETEPTEENAVASKIKLPPITVDLISELKSVCHVSSLTCKNETENYEYAKKCLGTMSHPIHNAPEKTDLVTLMLQQEELRKRWSDTKYLKEQRKRHLDSYERRTTPSTDDQIDDAVDQNEVMVTVMIFDPSKSHVKRCLKMGALKYLILGSQKLTELRDKIYCISDIMVPGDFSDNPDMSQDIRAEDLYKSGYFFINDTFYNDMREASNRDYSKIMIDWAHSKPSRKLGPYKSKKMEETTFCDLDVQLGFPYLYMHQGNCEHIMIFTDLRLISDEDCKDRSKYPLMMTKRIRKRKVCMMCHILTPRWVTRNNDRLPLDPFFFCDSCFRRFNYDSSGAKIGNFIAQPYIDRVAVI